MTFLIFIVLIIFHLKKMNNAYYSRSLIILCTIKCWLYLQYRIEGFNCGSEVNNWLTKVIGKKAILIRKQSSTKRFRKSSEPSEQSLTQPLSLSNEAQYLMVSESTVEYLRQIMSKHNIREECLLVEDARGPGKCDRHLDNDAIIARFRCNFLISGADAFTEESWDKVLLETAGGEEIELKCSGLCNRCSMVCVDHTTGERSIEPLRTIGTLPPPVKLEKTKQRRNQFGVYLCSNENSSPIECGARLSVLKNNWDSTVELFFFFNVISYIYIYVELLKSYFHLQ